MSHCVIQVLGVCSFILAIYLFYFRPIKGSQPLGRGVLKRTSKRIDGEEQRRTVLTT